MYGDYYIVLLLLLYKYRYPFQQYSSKYSLYIEYPLAIADKILSLCWINSKFIHAQFEDNSAFLKDILEVLPSYVVSCSDKSFNLNLYIFKSFYKINNFEHLVINIRVFNRDRYK